MAFIGLSYLAGRAAEKACDYFEVDEKTKGKIKWAARIGTMVVLLDPTDAIGDFFADKGAEVAAEAGVEAMDQLEDDTYLDNESNKEEPAATEKKTDGGVKFGGSTHTCSSCGGSGGMWANSGGYYYTCTSCGGSGTW